jgi:hypothetical protein
MVTTEAVSGLDGSSYSSTQKWVAMGDDDLVRFVYFANNGRDLHFVQCLDEDCATISDELVVSNSHNTDEPALYVGTDGFARISYVTYDTPNELHHVRCTNASCSAKVDTLVDTSDSVGKTAYSHTSIAMGVDGFARIVYDNYDATSALRLATCNDADCTAPTLTTVVASGNYLETSSVAVGDDGYARIVYVDSSPNPKELHFIQCTNAGCTTRNNGTLASSVILYYVDIVMGLDGYAS